MTTKMRMTLTIDVECPEDNIEDAFPAVRQTLLKAGLGPWKWTIEDFDAFEGFKRQRKWSPRSSAVPSPTPETP